MAAKQLREIVEADRHVGMVRPVARLVDRQRAAIGGSASPRRFVSWSKCARLLRRVATRDRPAAGSPRRSPAPGARAARPRRSAPSRQAGAPSCIEQPSGRLRDPRLVRPPRDRERVRRERVEDRPASHVLRVADERVIDPPQRLPQRLAAPLLRHRPPGEILHQAMDDESLSPSRPRRSRA